MKAKVCADVVLGICAPPLDLPAPPLHLVSSPLVHDLLVGTLIPSKGQVVHVRVISNVAIKLTVLKSTGFERELDDDNEEDGEKCQGYLCTEETVVVLLRIGEWVLNVADGKDGICVDGKLYPPYWEELVEGLRYMIGGLDERQRRLEEIGIGAPRLMLFQGGYGTGKTSAVEMAARVIPGAVLVRANAAHVFKRCVARANMIDVVRFYIKAAILAKPAIVVFDDACFTFPQDDDTAAAALRLVMKRFQDKLANVAIVLIASPDLNVLHESIIEMADLLLDLNTMPSIADANWMLARAARKACLKPKTSEKLRQVASLAQGLNPGDIFDSVNSPEVQDAVGEKEAIDKVQANLKSMHKEAKMRVGSSFINVVEHSNKEDSGEPFNFVGGLAKAKEALEEGILWGLEEAETFKRMGVQSSPSVLLYGPPGTGKTLLARHVVNLCKASMLSVDAAFLARGEVGASEKILSAIFQKAAAMAPAVIFMDELDALFLSKDDNDATGGAPLRRLVSSLILAMDNLPEGVAVLGASNRPWAIDSTLLSAGRFDRCVHVPLPDVQSRKSILSILAKRMGLSPESTATLVNMAVESVSGGWSGADITGACRKAAMQALDRDNEIEAADIRAAFSTSFPSVDPDTALRLTTWQPP